MKYLLVFVLVFSLDGCGYKNTDYRHQIITIHNNSKKNIYFYSGTCEGKLNGYNPFNDPSYYIAAESAEKYYSSSFESDIERAPCKRLVLNFFDEKVLSTIPRDSMLRRGMILKTKSYSKDQLDSLGWRIDFP